MNLIHVSEQEAITIIKGEKHLNKNQAKILANTFNIDIELFT